MFWNLILTKIVNKNKLSISTIKNKNLSLSVEKKIKILFKKFNIKKNYDNVLINNFIKNLKNKINIQNIKINYINVLLKKNKITTNKKDILKLLIILNKKQTYVNISFNFFKKIHNTNGMVLKKSGILEKSRKKDSKTSILNINESIKYLKNFNFKKTLFIINIKKLKPFLNKINKILKNEITNNCKIVITPSIPFYKNKFKKIKSIKRRLRKKYNVIDV